MRFFLALFFIFAPLSASATQWLKFDEKTFLVAPPSDARYLTSNQAVLVGQKCAAIIDAHGDFSALERFASEVKKRIPQPICHLFSTSSDEEQILGMMLLANEFPDATWYATSHVSQHFNEYQSALKDKLSRFEKSLQLSQSRLETHSNAQMQQRLNKAKARIDKWQSRQFSPPTLLDAAQVTLDLGGHFVVVEEIEGATLGGLSILSHHNLGLFAGLTANPIPYVQDSDLGAWLATIKKLRQSEKVTWLLPAQGKPYKLRALQKPISFLEAAINSDSMVMPEALLAMYKSDEITQTRLKLMYDLAKTKQAQKMQKQRTVL
ncbi:MBL fold metallo-hydrolase [Pseudoalteromonas phenolica]|uniref:Uncharacterized protein n=1 Tax=Pseudoalteromonas phenolica TaxID=161398 RepID=A0A0S2JY17_9GAMM|nr:hypothetical protein [Pseudoalteromonas phenolica]ALO41047.1 hypothetical protein PP2015_525 [Pseudoalteromonas phenolica]TMO55116.1 hypothetical protein CWC21_11995 [Pseudoalteromonas phenolica]